MTKRLFLVLFGAWCGAAFAALPSEITVTLKPAHDVYVEGERIHEASNAPHDIHPIQQSFHSGAKLCHNFVFAFHH